MLIDYLCCSLGSSQKIALNDIQHKNQMLFLYK